MTIYSHIPVQTNIIQLLINDAALSSLVTGVFDKVPQRTAFPYVQISRWDTENWSSISTNGLRHDIEISIWGRKAGMVQTADIAQRIHSLLHLQSLSIVGHHLVLLRFNASENRIGEDGSTYATRMYFTALTHQTN